VADCLLLLLLMMMMMMMQRRLRVLDKSHSSTSLMMSHADNRSSSFLQPTQPDFL